MEPYVIIIQGSKSDSPYGEQIVSVLEVNNIRYVRRIASADRTPEHLQTILNQFNVYDNLAIIPTIGMRDAASGAIAGTPGFSGRVVANPPDIEKYGEELKRFSSTETPKGVDVKFARTPEEAVKIVKGIFASYDPTKIEEVYNQAIEKREQKIMDDAELQGIEDPLPYTVLKKGKVRDVYDLGDKLLIRATDRISAFDVVLPNKIPHKGEVLNMISYWWFDKTSHIMPNHVIESYDERSMLVRKVEPLPVELVVRGYLYGSMEGPYNRGETYCGMILPKGLQKADKLPSPILTPTTKAETGHDQPLTMKELENMIGSKLAKELEEKCIEIYLFAVEKAEPVGIIYADTKFEVGLLPDKTPILIDELLTPDSSRIWPKDKYKVGGDQESFDKQPVRDWLINVAKWNKQPPAPELPEGIIESTTRRYIEGYEKLTGLKLLN